MKIDDIIIELQKGALRESSSIEFKRDLPHDPSIIAKHIVALANSQGGYLIVGVQENAKDIVLVGVKDSHEMAFKLDQILRDYTTNVIAEPSVKTINNIDLVFLKVEKCKTMAYYSRKQTSPERITAYIRKANDSKKVKEEVLDKKSYKVVFKYMSLEAFLISLYNRTWRFFEPKKWNDKFERRFYCANFQIPGSSANTPLLFATCITRAKNSEAAWKVYSHGQGLGSHCIQMELDVVELRKELAKSGMLIDERSVVYKSEKYILDLHKRKSNDYSRYFANFTYDKYLSLLTLKREAYSYEQEVRLFARPNVYLQRSLGRKCLYNDMHLDWSKVIRKVKIDHSCSDAELVSVQQACFSVGINPVIKNYTFVGNLVKPANCVDIEFERFDIDAMPGRQRITIK